MKGLAILAGQRLTIPLFVVIAMVASLSTLDKEGARLLLPVINSGLGLFALHLAACTLISWRRLRWGVRCMHTALLVIVVGWIIGGLFGFVATVNLFQGDSVDRAYRWDREEEMAFPFRLELKEIVREYYPYHAKIGVLEGDQKKELLVMEAGQPYPLGPYQLVLEDLDPGRGVAGIAIFATDRTEEVSRAPGKAQERPTDRTEEVSRAPGKAQERPTDRTEEVSRAPGKAQEQPTDRTEEVSRAPGKAQERPTDRTEEVSRVPGKAQERPTDRTSEVSRAPGKAQEQPAAKSVRLGTCITGAPCEVDGDSSISFRLVAFKPPRLRQTAARLGILTKDGVEEGIAAANSPYLRQGFRFCLTQIASDDKGRPYAGIQIGKDPGIPVVYGGFILFLLGALLELPQLFRGRIRG